MNNTYLCTPGGMQMWDSGNMIGLGNILTSIFLSIQRINKLTI